MTAAKPGKKLLVTRGVTLIELVIVVAVMGILLGTAVPSYKGYMLRVYRTEAVGLLLKAAMCQQQIRAAGGLYDTARCTPAVDSSRYRIVYEPTATQTDRFLARAIPQGDQRNDRCGSLSLDQNGARSISATRENTVKCWSGR